MCSIETKRNPPMPSSSNYMDKYTFQNKNEIVDAITIILRDAFVKVL